MKKTVATLVASLFVLLPASGAVADQLFVDFEDPTYVLGPVDAQDGWSALGSVGSGCAVYDVEVATNSYGYAAFGGQSLRQSNAFTSGCFGDQTYSKSLADEAGETDAENGGWSGGTRQSYFEAEWSFASTVPGAEQPGLSVVLSPDRGDGARMSWLQMTDTPGGLEINFYDYLRGRTIDPCGCCPPFGCTTVATGLDRTVPHTVKMTMELLDGDTNDIVNVYVDGTLMHTGTSWEDFFRDAQPPGSRTVDSVLFRMAGGAAPATDGAGFVIDNLTLFSGAFVTIDVRPKNLDNQINTSARQLVPVAIFSTDSFDAVAEIDIDSVDSRGAKPSVSKFNIEDVDGDGLDDLVLFFRARSFDPPTDEECNDPAAQLVVTGVVLGSGASFTGSDRVSWIGPACR